MGALASACPVLQEEILRLDVAVEDSIAVHVIDGLEHLVHVMSDLRATRLRFHQESITQMRALSVAVPALFPFHGGRRRACCCS